MSEHFRLGMIGIGDMAAVHAAGAQRLGIPLAIAAGRNPAKAREFASSTGGTFYDSVEAMLADSSVTAVDLCVPNDLHRSLAEHAFAAGKHVFCEKPIAMTLEDADAMIDGAKQAGVVLMIGHVVRFWPEYARVREGIKTGEFGKVEWLSMRRLTGLSSAMTDRDNWRADASRGGGAVLDLQIHDLDVLCWLLGDPRSIYSRGVKSSLGTWDHVLTAASFDGVTAMIEASFLMQGYPFEISFHVVTEKGTIGYRYSPMAFALHGLTGESEGGESAEQAPSLKLMPAGSDPVPLYTPRRDSFDVAIDGEIQEFVDAVTENRAPACSGEDARRSLAVALASLESCESGNVQSGPF
ncbi:MAG: Gfo/Idh/MocA family oxidoreductase [Thermomicrobiales bacterium]|jgi:predicted dehydrogenase|nr:Gfo/Idh/MocA family oxidoreductase [Thermomicrobiales bacterium]